MSGIAKLLANALSSSQMIQTPSYTESTNPFAKGAGNIFIRSENNPFSYAQNRPVPGGYFAGYYNNQPNIVGRRLFIEV
jgi:hypothetical protein